MTAERPATRADLRAATWQAIRWYTSPRIVGDDTLSPAIKVLRYLRMLAVLDAEEAGDAGATREVARYLRGRVVETDSAGFIVDIRPHRP